MLQLLITNIFMNNHTGETIMKINRLDYVRTEAFSLWELTLLEELIRSQGYKLTDEVNSYYVGNWLEYGVDESGHAVFWNTQFLEKWEGNDITEQFRDYLDKRGADVEKEESSNSKSFTKDDLKDGMVVNFRRGDSGLIFNKMVYSTSKEDFANLSTKRCIIGLERLKEDLSHKDLPYYEIIKVSYMDEVLWERIEETPEQKRIKELEKIISEAQKALEGLQ